MCASSSSRRPAYTLMEMLLVMALMVIAAAISIPLVQTMMADSRITGAGDAIRGRMAECRARAMDEGRPWKFAFLAGTRNYQLAPEDSTEWTQQSKNLTESSSVIRDQLPEEVYFAINREDIMNGSDTPTAGSDWVTAATYLPDGTARDDTVTYFGKPSIMPMRVRLRGITGTVSVEAVKDSKGGTP